MTPPTRIKNKTCSKKGCRNVARGIIRTHYVCKRCYWYLKEDNKQRINKGMTIPETLELLE